MRRTIPALCCSILFGCSPQQQPDARNEVEGAQCDIAGDLAFVAGALRNDGAGWYAIADEEHRPLNIAAVSTRDGMIVVEYTFEADSIVSLIVTPDESLAREGFSAGASVGIDRARISLADGGTINPWDVSTEDIPWSNLWVQGLFKASCE